LSEACDLSIVIPAFNEAGRIRTTLDQLVRFLDDRGCSYEITVVDDGSSDGTFTLCRDYAGRHPHVQAISLPENRGKGHAVRVGMMASRGQLVAFSDADMPIPPAEYHRFEQALAAGADMAVGSRYLPTAHWEMPLSRRITGWGFRWLVRLLIGNLVTDSQFGFKMLTAAAARDLSPSLTIDGFAFDAELIRLAHERGYRIAELPVRGVNASGSTVRLGHDAPLMLWQLFCIRCRTSTVARSFGWMTRQVWGS
jgi:dolichyl-phosphate beta-glucosyltransferase